MLINNNVLAQHKLTTYKPPCLLLTKISFTRKCHYAMSVSGANGPFNNYIALRKKRDKL